jgi:hypothetical protein
MSKIIFISKEDFNKDLFRIFDWFLKIAFKKNNELDYVI